MGILYRVSSTVYRGPAEYPLPSRHRKPHRSWSLDGNDDTLPSSLPQRSTPRTRDCLRREVPPSTKGVSLPTESGVRLLLSRYVSRTPPLDHNVRVVRMPPVWECRGAPRPLRPYPVFSDPYESVQPPLVYSPYSWVSLVNQVT